MKALLPIWLTNTSYIKANEVATEESTMNSATIVQKLWNYCNVLRDDGMSYGDYLEQLTYLLFLKMADERSQARQRDAVDKEALDL